MFACTVHSKSITWFLESNLPTKVAKRGSTSRMSTHGWLIARLEMGNLNDQSSEKKNNTYDRMQNHVAIHARNHVAIHDRRRTRPPRCSNESMSAAICFAAHVRAFVVLFLVISVTRPTHTHACHMRSKAIGLPRLKMSFQTKKRAPLQARMREPSLAVSWKAAPPWNGSVRPRCLRHTFTQTQCLLSAFSEPQPSTRINRDRNESPRSSTNGSESTAGKTSGKRRGAIGKQTADHVELVANNHTSAEAFQADRVRSRDRSLSKESTIFSHAH